MKSSSLKNSNQNCTGVFENPSIHYNCIIGPTVHSLPTFSKNAQKCYKCPYLSNKNKLDTSDLKHLEDNEFIFLSINVPILYQVAVYIYIYIYIYIYTLAMFIVLKY